MNENKWVKSKFTKKIRISENDMNFIRAIKGKKALVSKLAEIINKYRSEAKKIIKNESR
jgi:hypothetical protein